MTTTKLTDDAQLLADSQPVIDVDEVLAEAEVSTDIEPAATPAGVHHHGPEQASAIEQAANAALLMPGVPGRDEFLALAMTARILSMSAAAPKAVQDNPHLAFHIAMIGRDLGISPSAALELIDVIEQRRKDGNIWIVGYQLSLSPQLLNGQIRRLGLGSILPIERSTTHAVALAVGPRGIDPRCSMRLPDHVDDCRCDVLGVSEFTWEDAQMAGLAGKDCQPGAHAAPIGDRKNCPCNQGYRTYPKRMMWWRSAGFAADDYFPEAGLGLYSPEELGAVVDEAGRPIDPSQVELPSGYEPEAPAPPDPKDEIAPDAERDAVKARIGRLPGDARVALAAQWSAATDVIDPTTGKPMPFLRPVRLLRNRDMKVALALVASFEKRATAGEWGELDGPVGPQGATTSPTLPQDGLDTGAAPDTAGEPETATLDPDEVGDLCCDGPDCGEPVVLIGDDGSNWCEQHQPMT